MAKTAMRRVLGVANAEASALTDAELLRRFAGGRDADAFADLVTRHGPMVLGVCRRILGNDADADDACQAVFLILVRKAGSIRPPGRSTLGAAAVHRAAHRA